MADVTYTLQLVPNLLNFASESGLDTSVVDGVSKQRTVNMMMTKNDGDEYKMTASVVDGGTFTDIAQTFADVTGISWLDL